MGNNWRTPAGEPIPPRNQRPEPELPEPPAPAPAPPVTSLPFKDLSAGQKGGVFTMIAVGALILICCLGNCLGWLVDAWDWAK